MTAVDTSRLARPRWRAYLPVLVTGVVIALVPLRFGDSRVMMGLAVSGALFAAYAIAFNIIFGSTGQLFLCVGALAGIGGYTSVILSDRFGLPLLVSMTAGTVLAALFGASFSWIAVRRSLEAIFVGIVTLAFSLAFEQFILGQREYTGGETGLRVSAGADTFLREQVPPYYVYVGLVVVYLVIYLVLHRSHLGWAFRALRDDEEAAELAGINVARYRIYAGFIGSAMIGLAGALFAHVEGFIGPSTYAFGSVDIRVLVMLAFGGIGTLLGPVIGAGTFTIIDELMADLTQLRVVLYGSLIVAIFLGFKRGLAATVASWFRRKDPPRSTPSA